MARQVFIDGKIYPSDSGKDDGYLALKLPLNNTSTQSTFSQSRTTEEQAISNLINLILTRSGERVMQPDLGVGLYYYVFDQITKSGITNLKNQIEDQINRWLPYIQLLNVQVTENEDDANALNILISFKVSESGANVQLSFFTDAELNLNIEVLNG